ncbi:MAG: hypothetical protein D6729_19210 [Deltaproteobacteria bacterium]|nr:MAG: hypothetical protein D6729_19210 [Deltaproteobacteria bacterium]
MSDASYLAAAQGALVLSPLPKRGGAEAVVRAATWHNLIHRIGHHVPLLFAHDLGRLLSEGKPQSIGHEAADLAAAGIGPGSGIVRLLQAYRALIRDLAQTELVHRAPGLSLSNEAIAALVARILAPVLEPMGPQAARAYLSRDLPLDAGAYEIVDPPSLFAEHGAGYEEVAMRWLAERHQQVLTNAERVDLDTLRLIALFGGDASLVGPMAALDLYRVFDDPAAADVIHFSLELLPQILETKRSRGMQRFSVDGVAGIHRRGNPDQIVPTELAYPDDVFAHKVAENQLLYYGREAERETERRVHLVLIDASASMRGARAIFARGLALTLVKKLVLMGEEVQVRFFDSRLHEAIRITEKNYRLPYLLTFRSERGRNYAHVFRSLLGALSTLRKTAGRQAAVYFLTHGQCHIPVGTVEALVSVAYLYGIYVLADEISLDYLPLLQRYRVVTRDDLSQRGQRRRAALEIVEEVSGEAHAA